MVKIVNQDQYAWYTECTMDNCEAVLAQPKREGRPRDPRSTDLSSANIKWVDIEAPKTKYCPHCGMRKFMTTRGR